MRLLKRLDQAIGKPGAWDRRISGTDPGPTLRVENFDREILRGLAAGQYDPLFQASPNRPSALYGAAQTTHAYANATVAVQLAEGSVQPETLTRPDYPAIARSLRMGGTVRFQFKVGSDGKPTDLETEGAISEFLVNSLTKAIKAWKFPLDAVHVEIKGSAEFKVDCQ